MAERKAGVRQPARRPAEVKKDLATRAAKRRDPEDVKLFFTYEKALPIPAEGEAKKASGTGYRLSGYTGTFREGHAGEFAYSVNYRLAGNKDDVVRVLNAELGAAEAKAEILKLLTADSVQDEKAAEYKYVDYKGETQNMTPADYFAFELSAYKDYKTGIRSDLKLADISVIYDAIHGKKPEEKGEEKGKKKAKKKGERGTRQVDLKATVNSLKEEEYLNVTEVTAVGSRSKKERKPSEQSRKRFVHFDQKSPYYGKLIYDPMWESEKNGVQNALRNLGVSDAERKAAMDEVAVEVAAQEAKGKEKEEKKKEKDEKKKESVAKRIAKSPAPKHAVPAVGVPAAAEAKAAAKPRTIGRGAHKS